MEEIVSMGKTMDLDDADLEEQVENHKEELTVEELSGLQSEWQKVLVEEIPLRNRKTGRSLAVM